MLIRWSYKKRLVSHFLIIQTKMQNKSLTFEIESFIFYSSTKFLVLVGKTAKPLISKNKIFLDEGEVCKVKAKADLFDLTKLCSCTSVEIDIIGTYEIKTVKGAQIKQFTAESVQTYNEDDQRKLVSF